jgi:NADPH-dependent glutamate synthase beta subunit-like oxidoreductase
VPGADLDGIHQAMDYLPLANRAVAAADGAGGGRAGDGRVKARRSGQSSGAAHAGANGSAHAGANGSAHAGANGSAVNGQREPGRPLADSPLADSTGADSAVADSAVADSAVADGTVADGTVAETAITARGRHVVIIGGGDTGADCLGTAHRQGAASVTQLEILPRPPERRSADQPWPVYPAIFRVSSAHEEGGTRVYAVSTQRFLGDEDGRVRALELVEVESAGGRFQPVPGTERELPCDLVLLAMGFTGAERGPLATGLGVEFDNRGNVARDGEFATSVPGVFVAGDMGRGQSLIVWAIAEGRSAAAAVDDYLCGDTALPVSVKPTAMPLR